MEANHTQRVPEHDGVIDHATLYLCRQGDTWVVVIESDGFSGALRLRDATQDAYDARFELHSKARRACPDAAIVSTARGALGQDGEAHQAPIAAPDDPQVPLGTLPRGVRPASLLLTVR